MQLQDSTSKSERGVVRPGNRHFWRSTLRVLFLLATLTWWLSLLVRAATTGPSPTESSSVLLPGSTRLPDARVELFGDWVVQTVGTETFVATRTAGDALRFQFAGTELHLVVRAGPDAGAVSIRTREGTRSDSSPQVATAILDLARPSARVETLTISEGLSPGIHSVEVRNDESAELAVAAILVRNRPGIWWAWLPPLGLGLLALAFSLHLWWRTLVTTLGWWNFGTDS